MNERILELAKQSGIDVERLKTYPSGWPRDDLQVLSTFAELIVRECAAMTRNLSPHGEFAEKVVKEHFGVKE